MPNALHLSEHYSWSFVSTLISLSALYVFYLCRFKDPRRTRLFARNRLGPVKLAYLPQTIFLLPQLFTHWSAHTHHIPHTNQVPPPRLNLLLRASIGLPPFSPSPPILLERILLRSRQGCQNGLEFTASAPTRLAQQKLKRPRTRRSSLLVRLSLTRYRGSDYTDHAAYERCPSCDAHSTAVGFLPRCSSVQRRTRMAIL